MGMFATYVTNLYSIWQHILILLLDIIPDVDVYMCSCHYLKQLRGIGCCSWSICGIVASLCTIPYLTQRTRTGRLWLTARWVGSSLFWVGLGRPTYKYFLFCFTRPGSGHVHGYWCCQRWRCRIGLRSYLRFYAPPLTLMPNNGSCTTLPARNKWSKPCIRPWDTIFAWYWTTRVTELRYCVDCLAVDMIVVCLW